MRYAYQVRSDPAAAGGGSIALTAGSATEIQVIRRKTVNITCRNVMSRGSDLTDREQTEACHQHALAPPLSFGERNTFLTGRCIGLRCHQGQGKTINGGYLPLAGRTPSSLLILDVITRMPSHCEGARKTRESVSR
jgi:hypothetical protein